MIIAVQYSCKKSTAPTPPTPTADKSTVALTSAPWKMSLWEVRQVNGTWLSLSLTDYQKSFIHTFNTDHTFTFVAASNLGGITTGTGTWKFTNNQTVIESDASDGTMSTDTIGTLSNTVLQDKAHIGPYPLPDANGNITTYYGVRFTWGH